MARQTPLTCPGHTRPVVHLHYSDSTPSGFFLISASKGEVTEQAAMISVSLDGVCVCVCMIRVMMNTDDT